MKDAIDFDVVFHPAQHHRAGGRIACTWALKDAKLCYREGFASAEWMPDVDVQSAISLEDEIVGLLSLTATEGRIRFSAMISKDRKAMPTNK